MINRYVACQEENHSKKIDHKWTGCQTVARIILFAGLSLVVKRQLCASSDLDDLGHDADADFRRGLGPYGKAHGGIDRVQIIL